MLRFKRLDHRLRVVAAQRDHVGGREFEVGRQPHLGYGDDVRGDDVVVDVAARQHFRQLVADELADAQLPLRWRRRLRFLGSGH